MSRQTHGGPRRTLIGLTVAASFTLMTAVGPVAAVETSVDAPWQVVLHVETPAYALDATGLRVAGYGVNDAPGAPVLPVWSTTVELPADGEWELSFESAGERLLAVNSPLPAMPSPEALVLPWGWQGADAFPETEPLRDRPDPPSISAMPSIRRSPCRVGQKGGSAGGACWRCAFSRLSITP